MLNNYDTMMGLDGFTPIAFLLGLGLLFIVGSRFIK